MSNKTVKERSVVEYYEAIAGGYAEQYHPDALRAAGKYPNNYFRLQLLLNSFISRNLRRVIEVGVGEGTPLSVLAGAGLDVWGFDISQNMVRKARENVQRYGIDPAHIFRGDIADPVTYAHVLKEGGRFDGLLAMGVMPHVENDDFVLANMSTLLKPGGTVFVEFRNKLFSLFTGNRLTLEFVLDDLLRDVDAKLKQAVAEALTPHLRMDLPSVERGYDAIPAKFHNPFEVEALFRRHGFTDLRVLWYHYHAAPPMLERECPELFRRESMKLEHEPSGWRGMFLCSAFAVEAKNRE